MTLSALEVVAWAKIVVVASVLIGASISDVRTRRVPDRYWIVMLLAGSFLLCLEILLMGPRRPGLTLLSLCLPAIGAVFIVWGYPEIGKALRGVKEDLLFTVIYLVLVLGAVASYVLGDRIVSGKVLWSFVFMALYFAMYTFPILGARLIHGGADAKCLMALAAIFPWYGGHLPISVGPFYDALARIDALEYVSPVHLGVLMNGAFVTVLIMAVFLPIKNLTDGTFHPLRSWTSYWSDLDSLQGKHVWVLVDGAVGKDRKQDPTPGLIDGLRRKGAERVRVTPKIPFILSLTLGFLAQLVVGNAIFALMFMVG